MPDSQSIATSAASTPISSSPNSPTHHHSQLSTACLPLSCDPPTSSNAPANPLNWVVFGATGHLGRSIVRSALARGDKVTAVGRIKDDDGRMEGWHANCQGLLCDVRVEQTVEKVMKDALCMWGVVDVVVNCTGYGIIGSCEDQDEDDVRGQFNTNVMGTVNIIKAALPHFKERKRGRYIIFSSIAGALGMPGLGPYSATKWAVEGLVESLMYEVESLGVKVTVVQPGLSRRDEPDETLGGRAPPFWGHFVLKYGTDSYRDITNPSLHAIRMIDWVKYRQPTSAVKIAETVWELAHCRDPPFRLLLGSHAVDTIRDRLKFTIEDIEEWKYLSGMSEKEDKNAHHGESSKE